MNDNFIVEEWYCTISGGGCGGYILVRLNCHLHGVIQIVCPNCKHEHQRYLDNGIIKDNARFSDKPTQEIRPTKSAWSATPRLKQTQLAISSQERDGIVARSASDFLSESWTDHFLGL